MALFTELVSKEISVHNVKTHLIR